MEITTIGLDLAKSIFQVHAVDAAGMTVVGTRAAFHQTHGRLHQVICQSEKDFLAENVTLALRISHISYESE